MTRSRPCLRFVIVALVAAGPLGARPVAAQAPEVVLDSVFTAWRGTHGPGCTVGVDWNGTRITRAYGMANLEYGVPLRAGSVVESGSVAKQFTSAAVALLAVRGRLSLDDDIRRHLPEVPDFGQPITIRNLLQHTSGLRDQWALLALQGFPPGSEVHNFPRILDLVRHQQRLNFAPGAEYLYSNTGYVLAALIVHRVSGKTLADFSRDELFGPLGMTRTEWRADYRKVVADRATAYSPGPGGWVQDMPFTMVHGNGGLLTTVDDLLRWNEALTRGTIPGGAELVRMLETPGKLNDGSAIDYGLGLGVNTFRGLPAVTHGGATAGYRTYLARWPTRNLSVAVLCNAGRADAGGYANRIAIRLLGLPATEPPPSPAVAIDAQSLQGMAGAYRDSTSDQTVTFAVTGGNLTASIGGPPIPLTHLGDGRFWHSLSGEFRFERSGDGYEVTQYANAWRRFRPEPVTPTASAPLTDYVGEYRSPELEVTYRIEAEGTRLVLRSRPDDRLTFQPAYRDGFRAAGRTIRFLRGPNGQVTGFGVYAGRARDVRFERIVTSAATRTRS
jgi:CubicO group peptidase (beta-lactamase class C family)